MLTLTHEELTELTDRSQPAAQIRWLKERSWLYEVGRNWAPKVARVYFERKMVFFGEGSSGGSDVVLTQEWSVNADALRKKSIK